jgi:hypothetical protein
VDKQQARVNAFTQDARIIVYLSEQHSDNVIASSLSVSLPGVAFDTRVIVDDTNEKLTIAPVTFLEAISVPSDKPSVNPPDFFQKDQHNSTTPTDVGHMIDADNPPRSSPPVKAVSRGKMKQPGSRLFKTDVTTHKVAYLDVDPAHSMTFVVEVDSDNPLTVADVRQSQANARIDINVGSDSVTLIMWSILTHLSTILLILSQPVHHVG